MPPELEGRDALEALFPVSRETFDRLATFVALVRKWQKAENLIAPSTLTQVWTRHVADSAQLVALFPGARHWLDLGSGGGFPGLVVALLLGDANGAKVHLVESNTRKCAFLRTAVRETGAPAVVHQGRIEDVVGRWPEPVDIISARALAPLASLLRMTAHLIGPSRRAAFMKGVDYQAEIAEASQSWDLDLLVHSSRISEGSVILEISRANPRG